MNRDNTGPDISRVDFLFCKIAIEWGWSKDETAARLIGESRKAQEKDGEAYAARTARSAAAAAERRGQPRHPIGAPEQGARRNAPKP